MEQDVDNRGEATSIAYDTTPFNVQVAEYTCSMRCLVNV
jgi:hypothetical protein